MVRIIHAPESGPVRHGRERVGVLGPQVDGEFRTTRQLVARQAWSHHYVVHFVQSQLTGRQEADSSVKFYSSDVSHLSLELHARDPCLAGVSDVPYGPRWIAARD